jgi:hypothetical protein
LGIVDGDRKTVKALDVASLVWESKFLKEPAGLLQ